MESDGAAWWQHPHHQRSCRLAGENALARAKARALTKQRRARTMDAVVTLGIYVMALGLSGAMVVLCVRGILYMVIR